VIDRCPSCGSADRKIHGLIWEDGHIFQRCDDDEWHTGVDLQLTHEDLEFLADLKVKV